MSEEQNLETTDSEVVEAEDSQIERFEYQAELPDYNTEETVDDDSQAVDDAVPGNESWYDETVANQAAQLGFTTDDLENFGSRTAFDTAATFAIRQMQQQQQKAPEEPEAQEPPGLQFPEEVTEDQVAEWGTREFANQFNQLLGLVKQVHETGDQRFQKHEGFIQYAEQQRLDSHYEQIDNAFSSLDSEFFGSGRLDNLSQEHRERRMKAYDVAEKLEKGYVIDGGNPPPLPELLQMAYAAIGSDHIKKQTASQITSKAKKVQNLASARPQARGSELPYGEERAIANLRKRLSKQAEEKVQ